MKDYLAGTTYSQMEKNFIMKLARYLYIRFGVGNKDSVGWNVCDDDDRNRAIKWSIGTYSDVIRPHTIQVAKDTQEKVKEAIINRLKDCGVV